MDHSSAAEQRATAVAKLKRAASLPRMQNGRRPPMHVEAVSEGERSQVEEREAGDGLAEVERGRGGRESLVNGGGEEAGESVGGRDVEPAVTVEAEGEADADAAGETLQPEVPRNEEADREEVEGGLNEPTNVGEPAKPARKRRSRSRTRRRTR